MLPPAPRVEVLVTPGGHRIPPLAGHRSPGPHPTQPDTCHHLCVRPCSPRTKATANRGGKGEPHLGQVPRPARSAEETPPQKHHPRCTPPRRAVQTLPGGHPGVAPTDRPKQTKGSCRRLEELNEEPVRTFDRRVLKMPWWTRSAVLVPARPPGAAQRGGAIRGEYY